jgi:MFS family permease
MSEVRSSFLALCAVGFSARLSYSIARTPILSLFALSLGAGPEAIGFVVGISTVTGIFFKLPAGALSDLYPRRSVLLLGLLVFAVTPFFYLSVETYRQLLAVRFFHGFATSIYGPVSMAIIAEIAGGRRGEFLSTFSSLTIIGTLLGPPTGGYLLGKLGGGTPTVGDFHTAYLLVALPGVLSLLLALALWGRLETGGGREERALGTKFERFLRGIHQVMGDRRILVTSGMEGIQNMTVGALEAFLPIYVVTVAGLSAFHAGLLWGVQILVTILAKPVMGRVSDRYGRRPLVASGLLLCALSFALIPTTVAFPSLLLLAVLFGTGEAFVTSSTAALVGDLTKERRFGAAMGTFGTIFDIGHASGPILAGLLLSRLPYFPAFLLMSGVLVLGTALFLVTVTEPKEEMRHA